MKPLGTFRQHQPRRSGRAGRFQKPLCGRGGLGWPLWMRLKRSPSSAASIPFWPSITWSARRIWALVERDGFGVPFGIIFDQILACAEGHPIQRGGPRRSSAPQVAIGLRRYCGPPTSARTSSAPSIDDRFIWPESLASLGKYFRPQSRRAITRSGRMCGKARRMRAKLQSRAFTSWWRVSSTPKIIVFRSYFPDRRYQATIAPFRSKFARREWPQALRETRKPPDGFSPAPHTQSRDEIAVVPRYFFGSGPRKSVDSVTRRAFSGLACM